MKKIALKLTGLLIVLTGLSGCDTRYYFPPTQPSAPAANSMHYGQPSTPPASESMHYGTTPAYPTVTVTNPTSAADSMHYG